MKKSYETKIEYLLADFQRASEINAENLKIILSDNKSTAYGQKYGFSEIGDEDTYAKTIPLSDYSVYEDFICLENEFTAYPVKHVLGTSGTTGRQKFFPLTEVALGRYSSYIYDMPFFLTGAAGKSLHTSVFRNPSNIALLSSAYYSYLAENAAFCGDDFVGGSELFFSDKISDVQYVKAWLLLSHPEIISIQSIFLYDILLILRYLEDNWQTIIRDMRNKRVSVPLDETVKELLYQNSADEEHLARLKRTLGSKTGFVVSDILPNIRFVSGIGGKTYALQGEALRKYIGETPIHYFAYASSECMIGVAKEIGKAEYLLLPRSAYYEFLPLDGDKPLKITEISVGECYELVITTFSGLYRYKTGDVLRILSFDGECPVFEIEGRRNRTINVAGEKLDEQIVRDAVMRFAQQSNTHIFDFAVGVKDCEAPFGYALFLETERSIENGAELFDTILRESSFDYDDIRSLGMLSLPSVYILDTGEISQICSHHSGGEAHNKPHTFLDSGQVRELMNSVQERDT